MPRAERSLESRIAEHKKYRRQCQAHLRSGLRMVGVGAPLSVAILWWRPEAWPGAVALVAIPVLITAVEWWGFAYHDRALKALSNGQDI